MAASPGATATLRIASYNILADAYLRPDWYCHVDPAALDSARRHPALAARIAGLDADIICLQEVTREVHAFLLGQLAPLGYLAVHANKGRGRPDGCTTLYRSRALQLRASRTLPFADSADGGPASGHVALITDFDSPLGPLRIAATHLRWDADDAPVEHHIGYRQVQELLDTLATDPAAQLVVCGDLNGAIDSAPLRALQDHGFLDAYATLPQATCNPHRHAKRIDYIFHGPGLVAQPELLPPIDDLTPLPSATEPSDHLPIAASLHLRPV